MPHVVSGSLAFPCLGVWLASSPQLPAFAAELTGGVSELEDIARSADAGADPIELAKTYRWLGDAFFDLARGMDQSALVRGAAA